MSAPATSPSTPFPFDLKVFLEKPLCMRQEESERIRAKYPHKVPIIVTRHPSDKTLPDSKKIKFLFPSNLTVGQLLYVIRKHVQVNSDTGLYIFAGEAQSLPPTAELLSSLYASYKSEDGFLYMVYAGESTFG